MYQILIIDDHSIVRAGIKLLAKDRINAEIDESGNGDDILKKIEQKKYDLVLLDINIPDTDPGKLLKAILDIQPETKVLIFSMMDEYLFAKPYLKLGAKGFLSKRSSNDEVVNAIQTLLKGNMYISSQLAASLAENVTGNKSSNPFDILSQRELEVVIYLLKGMSISGISEMMYLHPSTVGTYKIRIFEKLNIKSLIDLSELARIYKVI